MLFVLDKTTFRILRAAFGVTLFWLVRGCDRAKSLKPFRSSGSNQRSQEAGHAVCGFGRPAATATSVSTNSGRPRGTGLAMQPYTPDFARRELTAQPTPVTIGARAYRASVGPDGGVVRESGSGGEKAIP